MDKFLSYFQKWASLKYAIIALALFGINQLFLNLLDKPLMELTGGEPKPDLRFGYDLATLEMLFSAYGEEGRTIYVWNLIVDTPFPIFGALAFILFVLVAVKNPTWQKILVVAPAVFCLTDLVENAILFTLVQSYPALSPGVVSVVSVITQVKRTAFYISSLTLGFTVVLLLINYFKPRRNP